MAELYCIKDIINSINECKNLDDLFTKWRAAHEKESIDVYKNYRIENIDKLNFYEDGIINKERYEKATPKVLFIAKESHINPGNKGENCFWVKEVLDSEGTGKTAFLNGLAMLYNVLFSMLNKKEMPSEPDKNIDCLKNAAFINLNKRGGLDKCNPKKLENYVRIYAPFIKKQIDIIKPDVIICCGPYVKNLVDTYKLATQRKVVAAYHPSYRRSDDYKMGFLADNIKMLQKDDRQKSIF